MADKKAIVVVCGEADVNIAGPFMQKFMKKCCAVKGFDNAGTAAEVAKIEGCSTVAADAVAKLFEEDGALAVVELGDADPDALERNMAQVTEVSDRRTLVALATDSGLYFGGLGINKKIGSIERPAKSVDIVATICYVADLPVPEDCTGAVLYQALKDPNMKLKEINKLQDAIGRMEVALQRDSREPWDKHDCA